MASIVSAQVTVFVDAHPDQEEKLLMPDLGGAVRVKDVPALYVREKLVVPLDVSLFPAEVTEMDTPVAGLDEFTVST